MTPEQEALRDELMDAAAYPDPSRVTIDADLASLACALAADMIEMDGTAIELGAWPTAQALVRHLTGGRYTS